MPPLLEAKGLEKRFGSVVAANGFDVAVNDHEVVGIIGANGAGKTTFVNMVTGYVKPDAGRIGYAGRDITPLNSRQITRIGISRSFQVPQVFLTLTVLDNLLIAVGLARGELPRVWRPLRRPGLLAEAQERLDRYRIGEYAGQKAVLLPQGVRKLLDIAMAVVHQPRLLLLDEPTSGVSAEEKFGIMDIVMGALKEQHVTVLFVEHDMEIIQRYSQRVLAFYDGAIIADGPPGRVLADEQVRKLVTGEELHKTSGRGTKGGRGTPGGGSPGGGGGTHA
jgi:branched-chain amino acid transport system ATP-binding protein